MLPVGDCSCRHIVPHYIEDAIAQAKANTATVAWSAYHEDFASWGKGVSLSIIFTLFCNHASYPYNIDDIGEGGRIGNNVCIGFVILSSCDDSHHLKINYQFIL